MTVSNNQNTISESSVILDPDILNYSRKSYSSLTDLNNEALFTDEYAARVAEINQQKNDNYNLIASEVFVKEVSGNDAVYASVQEMMFSGKEPRIIVRAAEKETNPGLIFIGACLITALTLAALIIMIKPKKETV